MLEQVGVQPAELLLADGATAVLVKVVKVPLRLLQPAERRRKAKRLQCASQRRTWPALRRSAAAARSACRCATTSGTRGRKCRPRPRRASSPPNRAPAGTDDSRARAPSRQTPSG